MLSMAIQSELPFPDSEAAVSPDVETAPETGSPTTAAPSAEDQRAHLRFDKMFAVRLESLLFGEIYCVARNISAGGIFLELSDPLPLGATVRVCFPVPDGSGEVVATGEVKNHYFINFTQGGSSRAVAGMAVRFTSFESEGHDILADCLTRMRVLH
jgi:PilZ domain